MRRARWMLGTLFFLIISLSAQAKEDSYSQAEKLYHRGHYQEAADLLAPLVQGGEKKGDQFTLYGRSLEGMTEQINTVAEGKCRFRGGGVTACFQNYASEMNQKYGEGSFEYNAPLVLIQYTGLHFDQASRQGGKAKAEAAYYALGKGLVGPPQVVLPRVQEFLKETPKGKWYKKGLLLWARLHEDIWWIHRNWSWILYNGQISSDELVVRAEAFRKVALDTFKEIRGGEEGKAAKREYKLLKNYESDGKMYGIVNESSLAGTNVVPIQKTKDSIQN